MKKIFPLIIVMGLLIILYYIIRASSVEAPYDNDIQEPSVKSETFFETNKEQNTTRVMAPQNIVLHVGETQEVLGLSLRLDSVKNDSRCSQEALCIWAGSITTILTVISDVGTKTIVYESGTVPVNVFGYLLSIVSVSPYASQTYAIEQKSYEVTFHIESAYADVVDNPFFEIGT